MNMTAKKQDKYKKEAKFAHDLSKTFITEFLTNSGDSIEVLAETLKYETEK